MRAAILRNRAEEAMNGQRKRPGQEEPMTDKLTPPVTEGLTEAEWASVAHAVYDSHPQLRSVVERLVTEAYQRGYGTALSKPELERIVADRVGVALDRVRALADQWNDTPDYTPSTYDQGRVDQRHDMTMQLLEALGADA